MILPQVLIQTLHQSSDRILQNLLLCQLLILTVFLEIYLLRIVKTLRAKRLFDKLKNQFFYQKDGCRCKSTSHLSALLPYFYLFLPSNDKQATAQKVNLLSISPHWSPMKLPWSVCNPFTYFTTPSTSISSRQSNITAI